MELALKDTVYSQKLNLSKFGYIVVGSGKSGTNFTL